MVMSSPATSCDHALTSLLSEAQSCSAESGLRQDGFHAIRSELFAAPIGLQHSIGVEQEAVAVPDREALRLVTGEWHDTENQAVFHDVVNRLIGGSNNAAVEDVRRRCSGRFRIPDRETNRPRSRIVPAVCRPGRN